MNALIDTNIYQTTSRPPEDPFKVPSDASNSTEIVKEPAGNTGSEPLEIVKEISTPDVSNMIRIVLELANHITNKEIMLVDRLTGRKIERDDWKGNLIITSKEQLDESFLILSKGKFLGVLTSMYVVVDSNSMKPGHEYTLQWLKD